MAAQHVTVDWALTTGSDSDNNNNKRY